MNYDQAAANYEAAVANVFNSLQRSFERKLSAPAPKKQLRVYVGSGATHEELAPKAGSPYKRYSYDGQYVTYSA